MSEEKKTAEQTTEETKEPVKKEKKTTIIISHDIAEVVSLCDRIIVLTKRPATIKNIYNIKLENKTLPSINRKNENFYDYYETIWKDLDIHV